MGGRSGFEILGAHGSSSPSRSGSRASFARRKYFVCGPLVRTHNRLEDKSWRHLSRQTLRRYEVIWVETQFWPFFLGARTRRATATVVTIPENAK